MDGWTIRERGYDSLQLTVYIYLNISKAITFRNMPYNIFKLL